MKAIIFFTLIWANASYANERIISLETTSKNLTLYAKYFGFDNLGSYLEFVNKIEIAEKTGKIGELGPLEQDPMYALFQLYSNAPEQVSNKEVQTIKIWFQERTNSITNHLAILPSNIHIYENYMLYRTLQLKSYEQPNANAEETEIITINCDSPCQNEAERYYEGALTYWNLAQNSGVNNYQEFRVDFVGGGKAGFPSEIWIGNNFSGAKFRRFANP